MSSTLRPLVPVLGTGFNRWLLQGTDASPMLTDWWALLRLTARRQVKHHAQLQPLLKKLKAGGSPTFAWEALVHAVHAGRGEHSRRALSDTEASALDRLASHVRAESVRLCADAGVRSRARRFLDALRSHGFTDADVLSLNFDTVLATALGLTDKPDAVWQYRTVDAENSDKLQYSAASGYFAGDDRMLRVWHPHGHVGVSASLVVGTLRYGKATTYVHKAFESYRTTLDKTGLDTKASTNDVAHHNMHRRRAETGFHSWPATAINAPLLLIGVGLSREETDIWQFLHLRARNHANVPLDQRPKIWRFTCDEEPRGARDHWQSLSEGLDIQELNLGEKWSEAWEALLDLLANPRQDLPQWEI